MKRTLLSVAVVFGLMVIGIFFSHRPESRGVHCPPDMVAVPGGEVTVVYQGNRWGGFARKKVRIDPFCIDAYEASQPDATAKSQGSWNSTKEDVPAPMSVKGVLPWTGISQSVAGKACAAAGKRLPTLAEWQAAYSGLDEKTWPWGDHFENRGCRIGMEKGVYPAGGCCFEICRGRRCGEICDMAGNVSEWLGDFWDEKCFGKREVMIAGGSSAVGKDENNSQRRVSADPLCWRFSSYGQQRWGLHHHSPKAAFDDDGFRCALSLKK